MRAWNERLVLSLVRQHGALAKSDIARMTGLSAQTVSVIMRALEQDGLLLRGEPIRGRIGQPSVPMSLNADGAFFFGLKIGRRSADLALVDFLGRVRGARRRIYRYPTPDTVVAFVAEALPALLAGLPPALRERVGGMGVAMPFQLWSWVDYIGAPQAEMDAWRHRDMQAELSALAGMPVHLQNDATAACGAELVFGTGERPKDFLYFYFGYFIGGGLVLNGQLFTGQFGNAAGVGPMPVPGPDGRMRRLMTVASLSVLADAVDAAGGQSDQLWESPDRWDLPEAVLDTWMTDAAEGLASAILSAATLLEMQAVLIDGWMPPSVRAEVTRRTEAALYRLDLSGIEPPAIRQGTVGAEARALGAAAIPLSQRYLIEQNPIRES
ncbi:ROK family transcriptional regulator [Tabrizicola aquatica]|uniref:ROK family transcriptional regulator n=1 Tax=Tabrizicola aquatica TaxID=909926 RepID=UPI000CD05045|nr:ROK family transcriptional regulator [Tabrizicola aquatica]